MKKVQEGKNVKNGPKWRNIERPLSIGIESRGGGGETAAAM